MNETSFLRNLVKGKDKEKILKNFAANFGLKDFINVGPQKEVIKKLNAENKKIQKKINAQLENIMEQRKKVNEYVGDIDKDNEITSIEELHQVKRRASILGEPNKNKTKFQTQAPKKNIVLSPKNPRFDRIKTQSEKTNKSSEILTKKAIGTLQLVPHYSTSKDNLMPITEKVSLFKKESNNYKIEKPKITFSSMVSDNDLNKVQSKSQKKSNITHYSSHDNLANSNHQSPLIYIDKKTKSQGFTFTSKHNKGTNLLPLKNKKSSDISLMERLQLSPGKPHKKIITPADENSLLSFKSYNSTSLLNSKEPNNLLLLNNKPELNTQNLNQASIKSVLSLEKSDSNGTQNPQREPKDLEHEKFRVLELRHSVEDSLSYSEGNTENVLGFDESIYVIDPDCLFKVIWDYYIMFIVLYYLLLYPFFLSYNEKIPTCIIVCNIIWDICYICDFVLNFFVAFYTFEEELVKNLKLIASEYINSMLFFFDLIASIPFGLIIHSVNCDRSNQSYSHLLIFIKLIKIGKIMEDSSNRNYFSFLFFNGKLVLSSQSQRMFKFLLCFLIISHCISCLWIFFACLHPGDNWIIRAQLVDERYSIKYLTSLYFHWVSIFTIGYGDILATNITERIYNCLLLFVGILIYSFAISSIGSMLMNRDEVTSKYEANINYLEELRSKHNIPDNFYVKLVKHFEYNLQYNKTEKYAFINDLPNRIKIQLLADMHRDIIQHCSFFKDFSIEYATRVVHSLKPIRVVKREKIVSEGEYLVEIYFIRRGVLSVLLDETYLEKKVIDLRKNEHFGDILVEANERCPFNLKVSSKFCDLLLFKKEDFNEVKEEFPEELSESLIVSCYNYQSLLDLAEAKKQKIAEEINKWKKEDTSDVSSICNSSKDNLGKLSIMSKSNVSKPQPKKNSQTTIFSMKKEKKKELGLSNSLIFSNQKLYSQSNNQTLKEDQLNDSFYRKKEQSETMQKQFASFFGATNDSLKNSEHQEKQKTSSSLIAKENPPIILTVTPPPPTTITNQKVSTNNLCIPSISINRNLSSRLNESLLSPNLSIPFARKGSFNPKKSQSSKSINFNLIIQNNNYYNQSTVLNSPRFWKRKMNRANSIGSNHSKDTNKFLKFDTCTCQNQGGNKRRKSCVLPKAEILSEQSPVIQNSRKRHKLKELDLEKFQKSEMFIRNMMENKKNLKQLENDPHQFFLDGMKNMLTDCVELENKQNEELIEIFEKVCKKYNIEEE